VDKNQNSNKHKHSIPAMDEDGDIRTIFYTAEYFNCNDNLITYFDEHGHAVAYFDVDTAYFIFAHSNPGAAATNRAKSLFNRVPDAFYDADFDF
jgi:hypothetical protein